MWATTMGISSFLSWLKKLADLENGRYTKVLSFISKIKLRKNWIVMIKKMTIVLFKKVITKISDLKISQTKI